MENALTLKWNTVLDGFNVSEYYRNICSIDLENQAICNRNNILHQLYYNFSEWFGISIAHYYGYISKINPSDRFDLGYMYFSYPVNLNNFSNVKDDCDKLSYEYFNKIYRRLVENKIQHIQFYMGGTGLYVLYY